MATKENAKTKFVNSVTDPLALTKMTSKLSEYLGITVSEDSAPVKAWKKLMEKAAGDLFDKCYENMKAAYK
jgi:hypothetical protein